MFLLAALLLIVVALIHGSRTTPTLSGRLELVQVYLLAGYHGVVMLAVALYVLLDGEGGAAMAGAEPGSPFQLFFGFAYLGMSVASVLTIWFRGTYLIGPVLFWSIYFFGAAWVHIVQFSADGSIAPSTVVMILATHALLPIVMLVIQGWILKLASGQNPTEAAT